ncbi:MAG: WYL domain-containing protein [Saprospiraceae bacterium]|nr:WYL domain-containing protein [Saprospiraceae bacterium]
MPTNKHAAFRYRVLDHCFGQRGRRKWRLNELVSEVSRYLQEEFGSSIDVSQRTIQGDINVMRSHPPRGYNAPILCKNGLYFYADSDFRITEISFRKEELDLLRDSIALIKQIPGIPFRSSLDLVMKRFENGHHQSGQLSGMIQLETNYQAKGAEWITPVYQAMIQKEVLRIGYQPFMEQETSFFLHPYLLKEWRNRWYLFGRVETDPTDNATIPQLKALGIEKLGFIPRNDHLWNIPLDRILSIQPCPEVHFLHNDLFDPATWFDDIVGVTKPENTAPAHIEIEADRIASYYLESKPLHLSQSLLYRDDLKAIFSLFLIPNHEFLNEILAYGKYVRVRAPDSLRQMAKDRKG